MWPLSAAAREVLRGSHQVTYRAVAHTAILGALDVALVGGTVTSDAKSQVRRTATVEVGDPALFPVSPYAALSPVGSDLAIEYGIVIPRHGVEWVPLIRGPIQKVTGTLPRVDALGVEVADRAAAIAEDRLTAPTQTAQGSTIVAEITRLIVESNPLAEVIDRSGSVQPAPVIEIEANRWADGVERLADAAGLEVFADTEGRFVIRAVPTLDDAAVWVVDAGGVLITADLELTRAQVYNAVVARGERSDGTPPVHALVVDDDPASPTRYGGPFGRKPRYYTSPLLTTVAQCQQAARALLDRVKGFAATVKLETIVNPALEGGDVIEVDLGDGTRQRHIVDQVPVPLSPSSSQTLATRSVEMPPDEGAAA